MEQSMKLILISILGGEGGQRVSVVSSASSGTTSGIVSDRGADDTAEVLYIKALYHKKIKRKLQLVPSSKCIAFSFLKWNAFR